MKLEKVIDKEIFILSLNSPYTNGTIGLDITIDGHTATTTPLSIYKHGEVVMCELKESDGYLLNHLLHVLDGIFTYRDEKIRYNIIIKAGQ